MTGGVVSGIGKGITVASLGALLKARHFKIGLIKMDPYVNVDAGTMNPFQHGEVFVTDDGTETDLDLGHYERFTDISLSKDNNITTGKIYQTVIEKERKGEYLGKTVQLIPHITNEIKNSIKKVSQNKDIVIVESGGTVGDIEGEVFIEAIRQFKRDFGEQNVCYIHVTKIDYIYPSDEPKTKPTQQAVQLLRARGIQPNILIVRSKDGMVKDLAEKIALFCDVDIKDIICAPNANYLYEIPLNLEGEGLTTRILNHLNLPHRKPDLTHWLKIKRSLYNSSKSVNIAMVGKYIEHSDAYISVIEALIHAGIKNHVKVVIKTIDSEDITKQNVKQILKNIDAIVVPGGFGIRGVEGKIIAINYARINKVPYLGLCLGLQCAIIEFARNKCRLQGANSTEFDKKTPHPVIDILPEQKNIYKKGGTMRLGEFEANIINDSLVRKLYQNAKVFERHRHRYEVNPEYHNILLEKGLIFSGLSPNNTLVEFIELSPKDHPFFVATQAHPEFKSRPFKPAPLFNGLIKAILK